MSIERGSHNLGALREVKVLNETECDKIRLVWRELNARNVHVVHVRLVRVPSWCVKKVRSADLGADCCFFIAKHLKIILENIDDFVR